MEILSESVLSRIRLLNRGRFIHLHCQKVNPKNKRASLLSDMIQKNKSDRKGWSFEILKNHAKSRNVFEKLSRPSKRHAILNALFIKNITDVISTGDVAPEVVGLGIEITGIKISPCCRIVNVYWQIPPSKFTDDLEIGTILNQNASTIRAEMISRNLMGRVPRIYFIRDTTNAYVAAFEKALKEVESESSAESCVIPDDAFLEKLYEFKDSKVEKEKKIGKISKETPENITSKTNSAPTRPWDMKADVLGLNHDNLMSKVIASKTKSKSASTNVVESPYGDTTIDLFSKIPGTTIHEDTDREELLKVFHNERKKLRNRKPHDDRGENDPLLTYSITEECQAEPAAFDEDFIEEDTPERF